MFDNVKRFRYCDFMKIQMLKTVRGSEDGFVVKRYHKGNEYDVRDTLARSFIRKGEAIVIESDCYGEAFLKLLNQLTGAIT